MQFQIKKPADLLDEKGRLTSPGWATDLLLRYDKDSIKAPKFKIKEWDYYCILQDNEGIALTVSDNGYFGFVGATIFDFDTPKETSNNVFLSFPMGSLNLPPSSKEGDIHFSKKDISFNFLHKGEKRYLEVVYPNFSEGNDLFVSITLSQPNKPKPMDTMVIATPFSKSKHAFYYNQKVNCMPAEGQVKLGDKIIDFKPSSAFGVLDWGRGVWTYSNTWYWGSASGLADGIPFGFNIGYGFGDTSKATENMLFYNNKAHKLDKVQFHIPPDDFVKPWKFISNDNRFEMDFYPIIDRNSNFNLGLLKSIQHQVFGRFSGKAVLDDGQEIIIKDFLGFAEKVSNKW
jgi:hypothetical protein